jgi:hypothetical protein
MLVQKNSPVNFWTEEEWTKLLRAQKVAFVLKGLTTQLLVIKFYFLLI